MFVADLEQVLPMSLIRSGREVLADIDGDGNTEPLYWELPKQRPATKRDPVRPRAQPIRAVVLHHTAGERGAQGIFSTLDARRLSVHFTIDNRGVITRHADLDVVCKHAGMANEWSVGIEISNRGCWPAADRVPRADYWDECRGRKVHYLRFFPDQVKAAIALVGYLCDTLDLPRTLPRDGDRVSRKQLSAEELGTHRGVLGHYHLLTNKVKIDPSPHLLDELAHQWAKQ